MCNLWYVGVSFASSSCGFCMLSDLFLWSVSAPLLTFSFYLSSVLVWVSCSEVIRSFSRSDLLYQKILDFWDFYGEALCDCSLSLLSWYVALFVCSVYQIGPMWLCQSGSVKCMNRAYIWLWAICVASLSFLLLSLFFWFWFALLLLLLSCWVFMCWDSICSFAFCDRHSLALSSVHGFLRRWWFTLVSSIFVRSTCSCSAVGIPNEWCCFVYNDIESPFVNLTPVRIVLCGCSLSRSQRVLVPSPLVWCSVLCPYNVRGVALFIIPSSNLMFLRSKFMYLFASAHSADPVKFSCSHFSFFLEGPVHLCKGVPRHTRCSQYVRGTHALHCFCSLFFAGALARTLAGALAGALVDALAGSLLLLVKRVRFCVLLLVIVPPLSGPRKLYVLFGPITWFRGDLRARDAWRGS